MCTDTKPTHTHQLQVLLKSTKLYHLLKHEGQSIEKTEYDMLKDSGGKTPTVFTYTVMWFLFSVTSNVEKEM